MSKRLKKIEYFKKYPDIVQNQLLTSLLQKAKKTEWGRKYSYSQLKSVADFQKNVPISTYEKLTPYIRRMMNGERNILWPGLTRKFSKSSGTSDNRSKFIPVSEETLYYSHFRGGKDLCALYLQKNPHSKLFLGRNMGIAGTIDKEHSNSKMETGDISAIIMKYLPWWINLRGALDAKTALMNNWDEKIKKIIEITKNKNIISISGVPTWTLILLKELLASSKCKNIVEIWPNFELFIHGAVSFRPYREIFKELLPPNTHYIEVYNASEGFFGIQDTQIPDTMLLMLDYGIFYEFIPYSESENMEKAVTIEHVKKNINYVMLISTNSGLWRYQIGDTIRFTSLFPHRFKITGRVKHFINAFGEEVIIENAEKALSIACKTSHSKIIDYTVCPIFLETKKRGGHEWAIEFETPPVDMDLFIDTLDDTLRKINSDYDTKRFKDIAMKKPIVHKIKNGVFQQWFKNKNKLGGQNKMVRLSNSREYVEEILLIEKEKTM